MDTYGETEGRGVMNQLRFMRSIRTVWSRAVFHLGGRTPICSSSITDYISHKQDMCSPSAFHNLSHTQTHTHTPFSLFSHFSDMGGLQTRTRSSCTCKRGDIKRWEKWAKSDEEWTGEESCLMIEREGERGRGGMKRRGEPCGRCRRRCSACGVEQSDLNTRDHTVHVRERGWNTAAET